MNLYRALLASQYQLSSPGDCNIHCNKEARLYHERTGQGLREGCRHRTTSAKIVKVIEAVQGDY